jgi:hypothetical protein
MRDSRFFFVSIGNLTVAIYCQTKPQPVAPNIAKQLLRRSVLLNASASGISGTPAVGSALLSHSGSGLADTVNHHPAHATAHAGLRDHVVWLVNRRERHCLCSGSQSQSEYNNSYCSDHCFSPGHLLKITTRLNRVFD